jgi:hypothetical protein
VNKPQTIAKLEALLSRVRTRAAAPRAERHEAEALSQADPATVRGAVTPAPFELDEPVRAASPAPPAAEPLPPLSAPSRTESDIVLDVDVQAVMVDESLLTGGEEIPLLTVPVEEVPVPDALESRERLVAAEPVALEPAFEAAATPEPEPEPEIDASDDLLAGLGDVEESPISSRRPLAPQPAEHLADIAFGAGEAKPPRHTPPPESGRLPAAPDDEFDGDITGVRDAATVTASQELIPEVTLPELAASAAVADVVGAPARHVPQTFVALLDASIAL